MMFANVKKLSIPEGQVKRIECGGELLWKGGHTNLVPTSIDTDGSIFNGCGYIDGYRLSSSGALKAQNNSAACGFIPAKTGDTVRLAGLEWSDKGGGLYDYIICYDSAFTKLNTLNSQGFGGGATVVVGEDGVTTFTITKEKTAYIRISATGLGADMTVTVNEEIIL